MKDRETAFRFDKSEKPRTPRFSGFFVASLALAAAAHLFFLEGFLLVLPVKEFHREKGFAFLGSILDSSQMGRASFLKPPAESDHVIFSKHVPVRSEEEYFKSLKDVAKPEVFVDENKKDVKSLFPVTRRRPAAQEMLQWEAGSAPRYQSLRLGGFPE